ncbi:MAG: hypothetical protein A2V65_05295 [Deltaproteobacteria bacterium RBG_13_49_15]|nr:MAG: hypothetical protein A2V65_05295 [Deltaproteobacteria bacterium RBG_13_49_15]
MKEVYEEVKEKLVEICKSQNLLTQPVKVRARALTTEEAIGNPEADDFPLQKGKERLMQAKFFQSLGQAFTDQYGDFEGTLGDILNGSLENNFRRAVFVSTVNAVLRYLGRIDKTIHCRDREPADCATELASYIKRNYGIIKIALIGFQPRMVESLAAQFSLRVLDMDQDNIGARKFHVTIEGAEKTDETVGWADLVVVTGTTLVNGTIANFLGKKHNFFYGTTISGVAHLMNWKRFCPRSH